MTKVVPSLILNYPKEKEQATHRQGRSRRVEYTNCFFKDFSTSFDYVISSPSVIKVETAKLAMIPMAGMRRTNKTVSI